MTSQLNELLRKILVHVIDNNTVHSLDVKHDDLESHYPRGIAFGPVGVPCLGKPQPGCVPTEDHRCTWAAEIFALPQATELNVEVCVDPHLIWQMRQEIYRKSI